jgi:copper homeostasis protein
MMRLEVPVDNPAGLTAAVSGGADRIELCAALGVGGLTPSAGFMRLAAGCGVPVFAMIRPRTGGFCYTADELAVMATDIVAARQTGLAGVVIGALTADRQLDLPALRGLVSRAAGLEITLHRAFDVVADWREAVDQAVDLGIGRILTSGGARNAPAGVDRLADIIAYARGRITILPGAGITAESVAPLLALPLAEVHASCSVPDRPDATTLAFGFAHAGDRQTDADRVRALKAALTAPPSGASLSQNYR